MKYHDGGITVSDVYEMKCSQSRSDACNKRDDQLQSALMIT